MEVFQSSQKLRVRVWESCRTPRSSDYGYGSLLKNSEVPGRYTNVAPVPAPAPGYFQKGIPVPRVLCHGHTELAEAPGKGMIVIQNLQEFRYGYVNTPGMVLYPTEHSHGLLVF